MRVYLPEKLGAHWLKELAAWDRAEGTSRLWRRDAGLWTGGAEAEWLGWLLAPETALAALPGYRSLRERLPEGVDRVVVLGMGGSSLGPEVVVRVGSLFRSAQAEIPGMSERQPQREPARKAAVLDSTHPATVRRVLDSVDPERTVVVASSKSGTTLETRLLLEIFWTRFEDALGDGAGRHFVAVTDPGSPLAELAADRRFLDCVLGDPEIGGRFSVLSPFGLVPTAIAGVELEGLLRSAADMAAACRGAFATDNPGVALGLLLAASVASGGDKLTLLASPSLQPIGGWLEQLIAESTGKQGRGLLPIDREPLSSPSVYGDDRLFLWLRTEVDKGGLTWREQAKLLADLAQEDRAVVWVDVPGPAELGAEFFRWEVATAVLGARLGVDPFDQPDVEASKRAARAWVERRAGGDTTSERKLGEDAPLSAWAAPGAAEPALDEDPDSPEGLEAALRWLLAGLLPGDLFLLAAWCDRTPEIEAALQRVRRTVLRRRGVATSLGFGPRYLHSTGQAHKGGPDGTVALFVVDEAPELEIEGDVAGGARSLGEVRDAQALGDLQVLVERGRRALLVRTRGDTAAALKRLRKLVKAILAKPGR